MCLIPAISGIFKNASIFEVAFAGIFKNADISEAVINGISYIFDYF